METRRAISGTAWRALISQPINSSQPSPIRPPALSCVIFSFFVLDPAATLANMAPTAISSYGCGEPMTFCGRVTQPAQISISRNLGGLSHLKTNDSGYGYEMTPAIRSRYIMDIIWSLVALPNLPSDAVVDAIASQMRRDQSLLTV